MSIDQSPPAAPRARANVTEAVRADVLSGALAPGSRLVELQLAERYGVSRASVRAAINELVKEGLVVHVANRGATVRQVAIDEAVQITEIRILLECLVAGRAAAQATPHEGAELVGIAADMRTAVADDRRADYAELNSVLHRRLCEISGHGVAADLIGNLRNRAARHEVRLALIPGRVQESLPQHEAIVRAVVDADPARAADAMRAHLTSVLEVLRQWERTGALR